MTAARGIRRRGWRYSALVVGLAGLLAACAPSTGGPMGAGQGMGGMDGRMGSDRTGDEGAGDAPSPVPGASELAVEAGDLWFSSDTVRITAGTPVNVTVTNTGRAFHDFTIAELDFMLDVEAGTSATGGLTVDRPGEYEFECTVPGHAAAGMRGTVIVEA